MHISNEDRIMASLSEIVALESGVPSVAARRIYAVAALHDIGKKGIPRKILNKSENITSQEFEILKTHTRLGAQMLKNMQGDVGKMARCTALFHHEWWNGNGYWGKYVCELPAYIPIISIADTFTALVSVRPYKKAWPTDKALAYIKSQAGTQFPPVLVEFFIALVQKDSRVHALFNGGDMIAGRSRA